MAELPKAIKRKIDNLAWFKAEASILEYELQSWFDENGIVFPCPPVNVDELKEGFYSD